MTPRPGCGAGRDSTGTQTSYLTLDLAQPRLKPRAELALATTATPYPPLPVFLWFEDSPRLCSYDLPFHEAVAYSDRLFAVLNAAQITFYDL